MAKQTINIGTTANDGTGDPIRAAFDKVNDNFTEIYTANTGVNTGDQNLSAYATTAAVAAGYQPLDSDLTAISALTTTAYGRALLSTADAATLRSAIGVGQTDAPTFLAQTLTGQSLTGTQATSLVDLSATWNTTGTPSALKLNVIDTASNAASKLMDLQVGGVSKFNVSKAGSIFISNPVGLSKPIIYDSLNRWVFNDNFSINSGNSQVVVTGPLSFGTSIGGPDLTIIRDDAGILAQRNGVNAQAFRAYNTFTDTNNKEWGEFDWKTTANTLRIGTNHFGSGVARPIDFVTGGVVRMSIAAAGFIGIGTASPGAPLHIQVTGQAGVRENLLKCTVSESGNDAFYMANGTVSDNSFVPGFIGAVFSSSARYCLNMSGQTTSANDTGTAPIVAFSAAITSNATDPNNGTLSAVGTRPLFAWVNFTTALMQMSANGNLGIGTTSPTSKLQVSAGDIEVDTIAKGVILKSPDGTRYRVTAANGGTLSVAAV